MNHHPNKMLFKVWNLYRTKKVSIVLSAEEDTLLETLILKASQKMEIDGSTLVLEQDGTLIDEDDALRLLYNEVFLLLQKNELWIKDKDVSIVLSDTITVGSEPSYSSTVQNFVVQEGNGILIESREPSQSTSNGNTEHQVSESREPSQSTSSGNTEHQVSNDHEILVVPDVNNTQHNEHIWRRFKFPWNKLPFDMLQDIEQNKINKGSQREKIIRSEVSRLAVNEMRAIKTQIPNKSFEIVAHKIIEDYQIFQDTDDDGVVLGDGCSTLAAKMKERHHYLNRKRSHSSDEGRKEVAMPKKRALVAKAGCSNWQPDLPVGVSEETIEEKVSFLNKTNFDEIEKERLFILLDETYHTQRNFLNTPNPPSIEKIQQEWPILCKEPVMAWHYQKLTNKNYNEIEEKLKAKCSKILKYGEHRKISVDDDEDKFLKALKVISKCLNENLDTFIYDLKDIKNLSTKIKSASPCIVLNGNKSTSKYLVVIERRVISEHKDILSALKMCYATYYVFNMEYPKSNTCFLEFLQRYLTKNHPDQGTKSKTYSVSKKKVISFITKLADFELDN